MRSLLFVPGDSQKKLQKGLESGADALILDLEDSVALDAKPVTIRNLSPVTSNQYYDDRAWLTLALGRAGKGRLPGCWRSLCTLQKLAFCHAIHKTNEFLSLVLQFL